MLLDLPNNTRRARKKSNSDHETLSEDDMVGVVNEIDDLLMPGEHTLIFFYAVQFSKWYELFVNYRKEGERPEKVQRTNAG